jgi:putative NIF3 family GTP cyclohydrolase 1 type 2
MVVPAAAREAVVSALRAAHPYEEPAFDLYPRVALPGRRGLGRVGRLAGPTTFAHFVERVGSVLPGTAAGVRAAGDPDRRIERVAVCGGAGDDLFDDVRASGADAYLTADLRHHPASEALETGGPALVDAAHWATEWPWLGQAERLLRDRLASHDAEGTASVETRVSRIVTDPWTSQVRSTS